MKDYEDALKKINDALKVVVNSLLEIIEPLVEFVSSMTPEEQILFLKLYNKQNEITELEKEKEEMIKEFHKLRDKE